MITFASSADMKTPKKDGRIRDTLEWGEICAADQEGPILQLARQAKNIPLRIMCVSK